MSRHDLGFQVAGYLLILYCLTCHTLRYAVEILISAKMPSGSTTSSTKKPAPIRRIMKKHALLCLIFLTLFNIPGAAQTAQETSIHLRSLLKSGEIDAAKDLAPVLARIKASKKEQEISTLISALAEIAEKDSQASAAVHAYLHAELAPVILNFVRGPYSPMTRDTVLMLLRSIDANEVELKQGIALAEAETAKGVPHFGNTARLLKSFMDRRNGVSSNTSAESSAPKLKQQELSFDQRYNSQMKSAQKAMTAKRYDIVKDLIIRLEADLGRQDPAFNEKSQWAYVYDFKRFALYELGDKNAAVSTCNQAIKVLSGSDWAYLSEDNVVRATLRACHNMLASELQEKAKSLKDIEAAIKHIESCFDTVSPIEDASVLDDFFQTRITIYLKAQSITNNKSNSVFQEKLFETLIAADTRKVELDENAELNKIRSSTAYLNFKKKPQADH